MSSQHSTPKKKKLKNSSSDGEINVNQNNAMEQHDYDHVDNYIRSNQKASKNHNRFNTLKDEDDDENGNDKSMNESLEDTEDEEDDENPDDSNSITSSTPVSATACVNFPYEDITVDNIQVELLDIPVLILIAAFCKFTISKTASANQSRQRNEFIDHYRNGYAGNDYKQQEKKNYSYFKPRATLDDNIPDSDQQE